MHHFLLSIDYCSGDYVVRVFTLDTVGQGFKSLPIILDLKIDYLVAVSSDAQHKSRVLRLVVGTL